MPVAASYPPSFVGTADAVMSVSSRTTDSTDSARRSMKVDPELEVKVTVVVEKKVRCSELPPVDRSRSME